MGVGLRFKLWEAEGHPALTKREVRIIDSLTFVGELQSRTINRMLQLET